MKKTIKKRLGLLLIFLTTFSSSWQIQTVQANSTTNSEIAQTTNFQQHFDSLGVNGSVLIYDLNRDTFYQHNPNRNSTAFSPASTFKIFNSLVALETDVIKDDVDVLTWDGIERGFNPSLMKVWNQDLNLRLAFKYSAVWFYQVLARRIGYERMQNFINQVQYGNQNIGTAESIDRFWLDAELQITPQEQINFLRRLYENNLPFQQRNIEIVKDIMIMEQTPNYTLRAKTGLTPKVGWYVGYLEQNDNVYFFATNLNVIAEKDIAARIEITRLSLQELGLL
ncbi:class D beta-lactamase [Oscillatoria salina]|uniref:class D beta-lactamase n=1 Tax=Oscillatoria salina TaxID=331517 RepID=UPI0013B61B9E|nr:class D beta-lactamase [Oscillatoria salina]MBZ8182041.1 class D beta-lactamase [Oscillatoria salina IIICB1]NET89810.1 class D beta-lactamase [Kamptonema sp. SIO1D9]